MSQVGQCVDKYWELKKKMAPGCEPAAVRNLMQYIRPHVFGMSLAGAGGGGFFYAIAKHSSFKIQLNEIISQIPVSFCGTKNMFQYNHEIISYHLYSSNRPLIFSHKNGVFNHIVCNELPPTFWLC